MAANGTFGSILLGEDESSRRRTLARSQQGRNLQAAEATTAGEAIEAAAVGHFDLMLLDVNQPDATGWDQHRAGGHEAQVVLSAVQPNLTRVWEFQPLGLPLSRGKRVKSATRH
jgi:DNA-binding response OmpR family regulator